MTSRLAGQTALITAAAQGIGRIRGWSCESPVHPASPTPHLAGDDEAVDKTMALLMVTGEGGGPVQWGQPTFVCLTSRAIAVAEVAKLDRSGRHLHIEHLRPLHISVEHAIAVRRLALLEIISHAVATNAALRGITLSLHHRAPIDDDGVAIAAARAALLRSFGAMEIKVVPDVAHTRAGQFGVEAVWEPSSRALEMLDERLAIERASYYHFITSPKWARRSRNLLRLIPRFGPFRGPRALHVLPPASE